MPEALSQFEIDQAKAMLGDAWHFGPQGLTRRIEFNYYVDAVQFFNLLAPKCEEINHHPDVLWSYTSVNLSLITHSVQRITNLDVDLAKVVDELANSLGADQILDE